MAIDSFAIALRSSQLPASPVLSFATPRVALSSQYELYGPVEGSVYTAQLELALMSANISLAPASSFAPRDCWSPLHRRSNAADRSGSGSSDSDSNCKNGAPPLLNPVNVAMSVRSHFGRGHLVALHSQALSFDALLVNLQEHSMRLLTRWSLQLNATATLMREAAAVWAARRSGRGDDEDDDEDGDSQEVLTWRHSTDDIRVGNFHCITLSAAASVAPQRDAEAAGVPQVQPPPEALIRPNEIRFSTEPCALLWHYPEPRLVRRLQLVPFPMETRSLSLANSPPAAAQRPSAAQRLYNAPVQIRCRLQYWDETLDSFVNVCSFDVVEGIPCQFQLPFDCSPDVSPTPSSSPSPLSMSSASNISTLYSDTNGKSSLKLETECELMEFLRGAFLWRLVLDVDGVFRGSGVALDPLPLAAATHVDSMYIVRELPAEPADPMSSSSSSSASTLPPPPPLPGDKRATPISFTRYEVGRSSFELRWHTALEGPLRFLEFTRAKQTPTGPRCRAPALRLALDDVAFSAGIAHLSDSASFARQPLATVQSSTENRSSSRSGMPASAQLQLERLFLKRWFGKASFALSLSALDLLFLREVSLIRSFRMCFSASSTRPSAAADAFLDENLVLSANLDTLRLSICQNSVASLSNSVGEIVAASLKPDELYPTPQQECSDRTNSDVAATTGAGIGAHYVFCNATSDAFEVEFVRTDTPSALDAISPGRVRVAGGEFAPLYWPSHAQYKQLVLRVPALSTTQALGPLGLKATLADGCFRGTLHSSTPDRAHDVTFYVSLARHPAVPLGRLITVRREPQAKPSIPAPVSPTPTPANAATAGACGERSKPEAEAPAYLLCNRTPLCLIVRLVGSCGLLSATTPSTFCDGDAAPGDSRCWRLSPHSSLPLHVPLVRPHAYCLLIFIIMCHE